MKMNYLLKSSNLEAREKYTKKKTIVVIIVLIILAVILASRPARNTLFAGATPIWKLENSVANSNFGQYFKTKQTLINENVALKQELFLLGDLPALNDTLKNENAVLKDLLGRKETKLNTVLAAVLVKPPQTPYDTLTVDVGEDQQIKVGDKVIADANVYIGEVSEVEPHSAKIILYSSPGEKLLVTLGTDSISAEAVGSGGGNFNILLPKEVDVKEGDAIIIPSIMPNIFGIVEKINSQDKDSFQTILFKSPVNISELNLVEIVIN